MGRGPAGWLTPICLQNWCFTKPDSQRPGLCLTYSWLLAIKSHRKPQKPPFLFHFPQMPAYFWSLPPGTRIAELAHWLPPLSPASGLLPYLFVKVPDCLSSSRSQRFQLIFLDWLRKACLFLEHRPFPNWARNTYWAPLNARHFISCRNGRGIKEVGSMAPPSRSLHYACGEPMYKHKKDNQ